MTLLATAGSGGAAEPVVAMANLLGEGDEAEAALLVRDDWQRRGLGSALLRRLLGHADRAGYAAVLLHVQAENTPMLRTLRRLDRPVALERDGAVLTATLPLVPAPSTGEPASGGDAVTGAPAVAGSGARAGAVVPAQRPG